MTKGILFCFEEANFQTRSLLVPQEEFERARGDQLRLLRENALHDVKVETDKGVVDSVQHLILQNFTTAETKTHAVADPSPVSSILHDLYVFADGWEGRSAFEEKDHLWLPSSISGLAKGFDHVANYISLRAMTEYSRFKFEIVEAFLVLETRDGKSPRGSELRELPDGARELVLFATL
jgi:hypothetical protein